MAKVYFASLRDDPSIEEQCKALAALLKYTACGKIIAENDFVAIKLHVGEERNTTHVRPELIKELVASCRTKSENVFLVETSTLYKGKRQNAVKHLLHAHNHGFGIEKIGAPMIMADGLIGNNEIEVVIDGEMDKSVKIAREMAAVDVLIAVSHPTGHIQAGLGACLKNLGMGLASRAGKVRQHSSILPKVDAKNCRLCGKCRRWCPRGAIKERDQKAFIQADKCDGCGECLTLCRYNAIKYNWGVDSAVLQIKMAEHAYGVVKHKQDKCFFINVLVGMTADCDCYRGKQRKLIPDLGILASYDPVAIDKATLDLTEKANGRSLVSLAHENIDPLLQLNHAVKLGMGSMEYELVTVAV